MLHAEPFETHLLSSELCVLFIYFLKGNCIGLEYHIILSKIHIIVIIKTKIIDKNKSCSNSRIFEEDNLKLKSSHSRKLVDKKGKKPMDRGKPYGRGNTRYGDWKRPSGGDSGAPVRCYNCGETGHRRNECKSGEKKCFKCGKTGHIASDCRVKIVTCYNC